MREQLTTATAQGAIEVTGTACTIVAAGTLCVGIADIFKRSSRSSGPASGL
jgi:hypothetical protein